MFTERCIYHAEIRLSSAFEIVSWPQPCDLNTATGWYRPDSETDVTSDQACARRRARPKRVRSPAIPLSVPFPQALVHRSLRSGPGRFDHNIELLMRLRMARELPIELLALIASSVALSRDEALNSRGELPLVSLVPFTTVSRLWQTLFEPHIYRRLHVYSKEVQGIEYLKGKLTCERLKEITSGPPYRVARRSWIRDLTYRAVVPHHLKDYTRAALEGYSPDNAFRRANDRAFSAAILGLFNVLSSWDHGSARSSRVSISLHIRLYGERKYLPEEQSEPNTEFEEMAWAHTFEYTDGATRSVFPYNAKFVSEYPTLSHVSCVSSVSFGRDWVTSDEENGVWAAAALHILQYCNDLKKASLDLDYYIRPDQVSALQHRREGATRLNMYPTRYVVLTLE